MVKVTYCDVCHALLDTGITGDPDSTDYSNGTFMYCNGSILLENKDLCGACARKVRSFIKTLKEGHR